MGVQTVSHETIIERCSVTDARPMGLDKLLRAHWEEVAHDKGVIALNPDWDMYPDLEKKNQLIGWAVLRYSGMASFPELIGYNSFIVTRTLHYRDHLFALNDVIYLKPQYRGVTGLRMIVEAENALAAMGVSKIFYHTKPDAILGAEAKDSLAAVEDLLDAETVLKRQLPDEAMHARTLADVLRALGYSHSENSMAKLLIGGKR